MGPDLKILHKLCNKKFNYYTVINIAIDLIKNIKILHDLGFLHRDLKPDNLVFGNLCFENCDKKKEIGIIDFSNAKINIGANGRLKYSNKKIKCMGNKSFSSTNVLNNKDASKVDDIISIVYILIYFYQGKLPWKKKNYRNEKLSNNEIIEIRQEFGLKKLCENLPNDFTSLVEYIFKIPQSEIPDYYYILSKLEYIKIAEEKKSNKKLEKFDWIELFKKYANKLSDMNENKRNEIKNIIDKYNIRLKDYLIYINY